MLEQQDYLADDGLATAAFLALRMQRPLFCEGDAGVGQDRAGHRAGRDARRPADPAAVLRGARRRAGALRLGLPAPAAAPAGGRGGRDGRRRPARAGDLRPAVPGRAAAAAGARGRQRRAAGRAARRRGRPGRRRVRGVPARGAQRLDHLGARARHHPGRGPAGRRGDEQPHPRGARRAQAPLPLPLAAAPRRRARGGDHPAPAAGGHRGARRPSVARIARAGPRRGPAQAARAWPSRWTGPRRCSRWAPGRSARPSWTGRPPAWARS